MFLLINKPKGITSHDVIDELRKITGIRKIGHAGTLDPNAIGLLIVGIGRESTKKLGAISTGTTKTYEAEIMLGEERDTDDCEGRKLPIFNFQFSDNIQISRIKIIRVLEAFVGEQEQMPPKYSAIKIKGKKAYELARVGKDPVLKSRKITIHSLDLLFYKFPKLSLSCKVSSGTYIRALARDIGRKLGSGAYLNNLCRTEIGRHSIKSAVKLSTLTPSSWKNFSKNVI